jgi:hypothetical protein
MTLRALFLLATASTVLAAEPPFKGTIFLDPDIITAKDPTVYQSIKANGRETRELFDRRTDGMIKVKAHLFTARFSDQEKTMEIQVNPEFDEAKAKALAAKHAEVIGRLPKCLRADVDTVTIHAGDKPFGGGNRNLLIHTGQSEQYERDGILEETLVHEASHTSLDGKQAKAPDWIAAQKADAAFISTYARDNPTREDVAETFLLWLAVRHRPERIEAKLIDQVNQTVSHRLRYIDGQKPEISPVD